MKARILEPVWIEPRDMNLVHDLSRRTGCTFSEVISAALKYYDDVLKMAEAIEAIEEGDVCYE